VDTVAARVTVVGALATAEGAAAADGETVPDAASGGGISAANSGNDAAVPSTGVVWPPVKDTRLAPAEVRSVAPEVASAAGWARKLGKEEFMR
jgi:hypothetical protein